MIVCLFVFVLKNIVCPITVGYVLYLMTKGRKR